MSAVASASSIDFLLHLMRRLETQWTMAKDDQWRVFPLKDALILIEKKSKMTDIFISYRQLAKPLNDYLATNDSNSGMACGMAIVDNQFGISDAKDGFVLRLLQHSI